MSGPWTKVVLPIGLLLLPVMGIGLVWITGSGRTPPAKPVAAETAQIAEEQLALEDALPDPEAIPNPGSSERDILEKHFRALGGVKRLSSIRSLLTSGEVTYPDGSVRSIVVIKKGGSRIRYSISTPAGQQVTVVTPEDGWRCLWQAGRLVMLKDLDVAEAEMLRRSAYIVSELFLAMQNSWKTRYLGQQAFNYEIAHCFEVTVSDRHSIRFFINPKTFLDAGREEWVFDADGKLTIIRAIGSEHMDIAGLMVPGIVDLYKNNVFLQTFSATDAKVNPGIFADAFDRPVAEVQGMPTPLPFEAAPDR